MSGPGLRDAESRLANPFVLERMVEALGGEPGASWDWLQASYEQPDAFLRTLWARADAASEVPLGSELGTRYDLFQAVCGRFQAGRSGLCAISWLRKRAGWLTTTFAQLAQHAGLTHNYWVSLNVKPGDSLCIVSDPGPQLALALAAGLRAGLVLSVVSPSHPSYLRNRVQALEPDHVLIDRQFAPWLGSLAERSLQLMDASAHLPGVLPDSYSYGADEPALRAFAPYGQESLLPCELTAHELVAGMLRDACLIWPVLRGDRVTVLGDAVLTQPMALLTTWFGGGELAFLDHETLRKAPQRVLGRNPNVWFVDSEARDALLASSLLDELSIDRWFRDPAEPCDHDRWQDFALRLASSGARGANLLQSAACAGSLLFSARSTTPALFDVRPTPGRPWQLEDLNGSGEVAVGAAGLYAPLDVCADGRAGRFVLSQLDDVYRLSGALASWYAGIGYPTSEVARLLIERAQADAVAAVMVPSSTRIHDADALLVVFVDPRWADMLEARGATWRREILALIEQELGPTARPDQLSVVPLLAQLDDAGQVDRDWARRQVLGNVLFHKARRPVFVELAALSRVLTLLAGALDGESPNEQASGEAA